MRGRSMEELEDEVGYIRHCAGHSTSTRCRMNTLVLLLLTVGTAWAQLLISPPSRNCHELGAVSEDPEADRPLPEYVAGEEMLIHAQVPHVEAGVFEFYLCPKTGPKDEDCLMRWPLEISGVEGGQYKMDTVTQGGEYTIPVIIPGDFTCVSCTLQWTLVTENCAAEGGEDTRGSSCTALRTTLCSDISIVEPRRRQKRSWDFVKSVFGKALQGAARSISNCRQQYL
ncbi:uncharacterized protein [Procambarus clarkii]|uniref:uncharacterized protein n=1 Tax=Procambarus clarkii TaxID=6728 RepID=UPI001E674D1F|nr:uncharacterized protein LOC123770844 [Procambarus clarkii]